MGLLDNDADELKKSSNPERKSGRKVNQSGLGALKGLSKYSSLTAKYRTKTETLDNSPVSDSSDVVEQSRGTISKSGNKYSSHVPTSIEPKEDVNVGSKSVQSTDADDNMWVQSSVEPTSLSDAKHNEQDQITGYKNDDLSPLNSGKILTSDSDLNLPELGSDPKESDDGEIQLSTHELSESGFNEPTSHDVLNCDEDKLGSSEPASVTIESVASNTQILVHNIEPTSIKEPSNIAQPNYGELSGFISGSDVPTFSDEDTSSEVGTKSVQSYSVVVEKWVQGKNEPTSLSFSEGSKQSAKRGYKVGSSQAAPSRNLPTKSGYIVGSDEPTIGTTAKLTAEVDLGIEVHFSSIVGTQRILTEFIFDNCVSNGQMVTAPLTRQHFLQGTNLPDETINTSLKRLRKKSVISIETYKDGRAGWTTYRLNTSVYREIIQFRINYKFQTSNYALDRARKIQPVEAQPSELKAGPDWFKELDFSKVQPIKYVLVNSSIRKLVMNNLDPDTVQSFIDRFTTWVATQGKINNPLGLFCDKLKELAVEGDSAVLSVVTEEERQLEAEYMARVSKARAELDLIEKAKAEQIRADENKRFEQAFAEWLANATAEEKTALCKPTSVTGIESEAYLRSLRAEFREKVFAAQN